MVEAFQKVVKFHLSVRQTEALMRRLTKKQKRLSGAVDPHLLALQQVLEERLKLPVRVRKGRKGGVLELRFYSDADLEALVQRLIGEVQL